MAVITKIEEQKNKKRVNIFVDDAFFCGLMKETALIFKLKPGKEVDESELSEAVFESEVRRAFEKASSYLEIRMHTKKELFDKLLKKGYEKEVIERVLEKLEEYHYVDDQLFAKQFASQNANYSKRMIENKLKQRGVSNEIVSDVKNSRTDEAEFELCLKQAKKYVQTKDMTKENAVQKMYASLIRKGFSFDNVKKATKEALKNKDVDDIEFWED